jgi:hypothetical protein
MATAEALAPEQQWVPIPLSESKAREWVAALPQADVGETTRRLFHGLVELNRQAVPPQTRLGVSSQLTPVVELTLNNLERHLVARSFPLSRRSQKIFELTQSLMLEFAGSWQVAALDILTRKEGNRKQLQQAIYHALDYMGKVLLLSCSVYVRTRETLWHDIHHLYLLAVEHDIDRAKMRESTPGAPTIEARYVQINLLALAKPYSLRQGEAVRVMQYFIRHGQQVKLSDGENVAVGENVHVVMLNSDEPAALIPASDLPHSPTVRVLNLNNLLATIDADIRELEGEGVSALAVRGGLSRNLAKRVLFHLTAVRNRSFNRFPKKSRIGVVTRMPEVIAVVQEIQQRDTGQNAEEDMLFNVFVADEYGAEESARKAVAHPDDDKGAGIKTWRVLNSSVGGYGLCWEGQEESGARVGEIVALRDLTDEASVWMVGAVKWMEYVQDTGLCCGVELLSTKAMVLTVIKVVNRSLQQHLPMDGLMLPSIDGVRPDPALILPAYVFQPDDEVCLQFAERQERVRLILLDECIGAFAYFRFVALGDANEKDDDDDFSSLWKSL